MKRVILFFSIVFFLIYSVFGITLGVGVYDQRITMNNITFDTAKVDHVVQDSIASHFLRPGDNIIYITLPFTCSVYEEPDTNTIKELKMQIQSRNVSSDEIRWAAQHEETLNTTKLIEILSSIKPNGSFGVTILRNGRFKEYWVIYE